MSDPLRNPKDPLHKAGPEQEKELFRKLSDLASGFPNEMVVRAAMNLILNAIRQAEPTRDRAERVYDNLTQRSKGVLLDQHYEISGKRRNIFPFDQVIQMPMWKNPQKF